MEFALVVYLIGLSGSLDSALSGLTFFLGAFTVLGTIATGLTMVHTMDKGDRVTDSDKAMKDFILRCYKRVLIALGVTLFFDVALPSEDTSKSMLGAYAVQKTAEYATTIEGIEGLPEDMLNAAKGYLKQFEEDSIVVEPKE